MARTRTLTVGILHLAPTLGDVAGNRRLIEEATAVAAGAGADWVVSGELVVSGYLFADVIGTSWIAPQPDEWMSDFARLSSALGVVSFLSHPERDPVGGALFNSMFVIGRDATILGRQRKRQPIPGAEDWSAAGATSDPVAVDGIGVGLVVCADAHRPDAARQLGERGAQLLVSSAAWWPGESGPNGSWEARSAETGLPLIVANRTGFEPPASSLVEAESVVIDRGERVATMRAEVSTVFVVECVIGDRHIESCEVSTIVC